MKRTALLALTALLAACGGQDAPAESQTDEAPATTMEPITVGPTQSANPETDVWLAELSEEDGTLSMVNPVNVTDRAGYDSQPFFVDNTTFLFTRETDGQTDTWVYDVESGEETRLTETADSEFAPMPLPGGDGFSVVRREEDGRWRVWAYNADGTPDEVLFADVSPVDFYAWVDDETAFLYVMEDTATMQVATRGEPGSSLLAAGVGRSMQKVPGRPAVSWVLVTDVESEVLTWELGDPLSDLVAEGVALSEDHAWTPSGMLLQPSGNVLHGWLSDGNGWRVLGEIPDAGLDISRVTVSPDGTHIALAAHPAEG